MKTPASIVTVLLQRARRDLYASLPDRAWFTQQARVKAALTLPAKFLEDRKVEIPAERYQAIVESILDRIKGHGRKDLGAYPCAYLHSCVESHLRHHGDEYYEQGKGIRNRVRLFMSAVDKGRVGADSTIPVLAAVHTATVAALQVGRRKAKSTAPAPAMQPDLFGDARRAQNAKSDANLPKRAS